ncbi:unknown [Clostridium sp. CAG:762]|nr:unknown [Clostridium sp. CAG:762]
MNKYKITLLILFLIILFSVNQVNAYVNDFPLLGKIIYLDAGH